MNGTLALRKLVLAMAGMGLMGSGAPLAGGPTTDVLYFFTTPDCEAGPAAARRAKDFVAKHSARMSLRPILLAKDFGLLRTVTEKSPLYRTIKELEAGMKPGALDIPLFDEEGLRLAEKWEVRSVPSFVLVRGGRGHRIAGTSAKLEDLWDCAR